MLKEDFTKLSSGFIDVHYNTYTAHNICNSSNNKDSVNR